MLPKSKTVRVLALWCLSAPLAAAFAWERHAVPAGAGLEPARQAQDLMRQKRNSEALPLWEAALRLEPANPTYHSLYGLALEATGQSDRARDHFRTAIRIQPNFADAHANLAYSLARERDFAGAGPAFDRALALRPGDKGLRLMRGIVAAESGETSLACRHFERASPWPTEGLERADLVFSACLEAGRVATALKATEHLPHDSSTQGDIGVALMRAGQGAEALRFLEAARKLDPASQRLTLALAEALLKSAQPERALERIEELNPEDRESAAALELAGSILLKLGRRQEARERFADLMRLYPENPEAYIHATQIPLEDQDWAETLRLINTGLERIPGAWLLLLRRAVTYKLMGRLDEARSDLVAAAGLGGDVSLIAAALGEVHVAQGQYATASEVFRKALVESGRPEFRVAYALALEKQGDLAGALREIKIAVGLLPASARVHYEYGRMLKETGEIQGAKQEFEHARALDPKYRPNLYALIRVYVALGEKQLAARMVEEYRSSRESPE
jgi:tetratricopeptide (TPR) repeat protein